MSAKVDQERASDRARERIERGWSRLKKLSRLMALYADGHSDAQIAAAIGIKRRDVLSLRQVLTIDIGPRGAGKGRLRERVKEIVEAFR